MPHFNSCDEGQLMPLKGRVLTHYVSNIRWEEHARAYYWAARKTTRKNASQKKRCKDILRLLTCSTTGTPPDAVWSHTSPGYKQQRRLPQPWVP